MIVTILENSQYLPESNQQPIVGRRYWLEDADEYTKPMRNLWEALVDIAFQSGAFSYDTIDKARFREHIKKDYGEGYVRLKYVNEDYEMVECKTADEIPEYVLEDFASGNTNRVLGIMKSTTAYTKKQFSKMIDALINAMHEREVSEPKFFDIIETITQMRKA